MQLQSTALETVGYARDSGAPVNSAPLSMQCITTMARPFAALLALLAASLLALPAEAQWKWKDKNGHIQYSDLPPPNGTPEQDVLMKPSARRSPAPAAATSAPAAVVAAAGSAPRSADPELEAKRKKAEDEAAAKNKVEQEKLAKARAENCARAKQQLATLESGIRLVQANAKTGEREFLDDKQRADQAKTTKDVIATDCK
jgi:Domain of unknown function (DUF4124)